MSQVEKVLSVINEVGSASLDAMCVINTDGRFLAFNRVFHSMLPRALVRRLKSRPVSDVITMYRSGTPFDLLSDCFKRGTALRYDEIQARIGDEEDLKIVNVSAMPLRNQGKTVEAALLILRDVTDEGKVQQKYQHMLKEEALERAQLQETIEDKDEELLTLRDELNSMQTELMEYRKGLKL